MGARASMNTGRRSHRKSPPLQRQRTVLLGALSSPASGPRNGEWPSGDRARQQIGPIARSLGIQSQRFGTPWSPIMRITAPHSLLSELCWRIHMSSHWLIEATMGNGILGQLTKGEHGETTGKQSRAPRQGGGGGLSCRVLFMTCILFHPMERVAKGAKCDTSFLGGGSDEPLRHLKEPVHLMDCCNLLEDSNAVYGQQK